MERLRARRRRTAVSLSAICLALFFNSCAPLARRPESLPRNRAFISYWPPPEGGGKLRLAVKDNIDMKGVVTTAGSEHLFKRNIPAKKDAACLALVRKRNVVIVGKANLSEFAVTPSGINEYFGTPKNPFSKFWKPLIPGGSSSGSAEAVASGMADVAFGTDTAGSIRVPAACCGIVGLKTTLGLIPLEGVFPIEPKHLDTVGPLAKDVRHAVSGMDLLESGFAARYREAAAKKPSARAIKIGRLYVPFTNPAIDRAVDEALANAGFRVVKLSQDFEKKWSQAERDGNTVAAAGVWISDRKYRLKPGIRPRTNTAILVGSYEYSTSYRKALERRPEWQRALRRTFKQVDFIAVPTLKRMPPTIPLFGDIASLEARVLGSQNTVAVNLAGNPALAVPVPLPRRHDEVTSIQLVGPPLSEAALLNAGRLIENHNPRRQR